MTVIPLRGYQAQASKVADLLERAPGVAPAVQAKFWEDLRDALGLEPGTATAAGVHADEPPLPIFGDRPGAEL